MNIIYVSFLIRSKIQTERADTIVKDSSSYANLEPVGYQLTITEFREREKERAEIEDEENAMIKIKGKVCALALE